MNYLRFWQAADESEKTSIRTKTRLQQIIQKGYYRGGGVPYGYRLEKQGHINKKNHECYDLVVDEREAEVVKLIYAKYVNKGLGGHRLVRYLLEQGIHNRSGDNFANTTITRILKNITYIGVLHCKDTYSDIFPHLQIIDPSTYDRAQEIMQKRSKKLQHSDVPLNTKGKVLLHSLVYCGHCGNRLTITTSGTRNRAKDGVTVRQTRYTCHYKVRHMQSCDGQSGYGTVKLDSIIEKMVCEILQAIKFASTDELINVQTERQYQTNEAALKQLEQQQLELQDDLSLYKKEIPKILRGESNWAPEILNEVIFESKTMLERITQKLVEKRIEFKKTSEQIRLIENKYKNVLAWNNSFPSGSTEAKKMIIPQLIKKIHISRDYKVEIDLNPNYEQFYQDSQGCVESSVSKEK